MTRWAGAVVLASFAGAIGFIGLIVAGWMLYLRLWGDSVLALIVIETFFGAAGIYAGWILAMLVFSAIRDAGQDAR
jgi:ABC-type Fe3+-siderophore transport system permease subunit